MTQLPMLTLVLALCIALSCCFDADTAARFFKPAFDALSQAWDDWKAADSQKKDWPSIQLHIMEPPVGIKFTQPKEHPKSYLSNLPELRNYIVEDALIKYVNSNGQDISITCHSDWIMFFQSLDVQPSTHLKLWFKTPNTKDKPWFSSSLRSASEKLRDFGKRLMFGEKVELTEIEKEQTKLEEQGFSHFNGKGIVFEELGYSKGDWELLIEELVKAGLPEVWSSTLKLAAKAKRGSIKSLATNSFKNGVRSMTYMKFQVLPDGEGGVDGLFAIYTLDATASSEATGIKVEQSFKRYVEMDAHKEWKQKIRQFLPGTDGLDEKSEL